MGHDRSNALQEKRKHIELKLADTQNIIRNKFKKACSKRLAHERDAKHAMKALTTAKTNGLKSFETDFSLPKATAANISSYRSNKSRKIVIRNKFKKTFADRLVHEHNVIRAMKPLTSTISTLSSSSKVAADNHTFKNSLLRTININKLCTRLKKLINSSIKINASCNDEIKTIIIKLREHGIIV